MSCRRFLWGFPARVAAVCGAALLLLGAGLFVWRTQAALLPLPSDLTFSSAWPRKPQVLDRMGIPLSVTYQNAWNLHDTVSLHEIPYPLREAFVESEDRRFFDHSGVDWTARIHAMWQNLKAGHAVRGASTVTEQVVRLLHPRPRTLWSRWLEGIEAGQLESRFSKATILEFYLNQVPYGRRLRGVAQAARAYFDRGLDTLSVKEMLALAVLVRAPGRMDLMHGTKRVELPVRALAKRLRVRNVLSASELRTVLRPGLNLREPRLPVRAEHFVGYLLGHLPAWSSESPRLRTTLDGSLQRRVQEILDTRVADLRSRGVTDGAVLVVDHRADEVLAWVNAGPYDATRHGSHIDMVVTPRQPGSTLKPFLYALALERGWTPATLIDDSPLAVAVGTGLHDFRNYSGRHYGQVRLREALGNSLNIPAVRALQYVGRPDFLERLHSLGFSGLGRHPDYYGDGLALGNGPVTLLDLVNAYATLAREGISRDPALTFERRPTSGAGRQVMDPQVASLIANVLSDPEARRLEFGAGDMLRLPVPTAVKTGTSSNYRDAWAVGFSDRHTVGVWMGDLDQRAMEEVTGSRGPALVLRAVFAELNRHRESHPLNLDRRLTSRRICRTTGQRAGPHCPSLEEWFVSGSAPTDFCPLHRANDVSLQSVAPRLAAPGAGDPNEASIQLVRPTAGLRLALDPRVPDALEAFPFRLAVGVPPRRVEWYVDDDRVGVSQSGEKEWLWSLRRGQHRVQARVWLNESSQPVLTPGVPFEVR